MTLQDFPLDNPGRRHDPDCAELTNVLRQLWQHVQWLQRFVQDGQPKQPNEPRWQEDVAISPTRMEGLRQPSEPSKVLATTGHEMIPKLEAVPAQAAKPCPRCGGPAKAETKPNGVMWGGCTAPAVECQEVWRPLDEWNQLPRRVADTALLERLRDWVFDRSGFSTFGMQKDLVSKIDELIAGAKEVQK